MWVPGSAEELEQAARNGRLAEKKHFEVKREVGRNKDVAIDVNAMALDGGAVVYGIGEDAHGRPTVPAEHELRRHSPLGSHIRALDDRVVVAAGADAHQRSEPHVIIGPRGWLAGREGVELVRDVATVLKQQGLDVGARAPRAEIAFGYNDVGVG